MEGTCFQSGALTRHLKFIFSAFSMSRAKENKATGPRPPGPPALPHHPVATRGPWGSREIMNTSSWHLFPIETRRPEPRLLPEPALSPLMHQGPRSGLVPHSGPTAPFVLASRVVLCPRACPQLRGSKYQPLLSTGIYPPKSRRDPKGMKNLIKE